MVFPEQLGVCTELLGDTEAPCPGKPAGRSSWSPQQPSPSIHLVGKTKHWWQPLQSWPGVRRAHIGVSGITSTVVSAALPSTDPTAQLLQPQPHLRAQSQHPWGCSKSTSRGGTKSASAKHTALAVQTAI